MLAPLPEIRRFLYGAAGIIPGTIVARVAGFHVITHHIAVHSLDHADPLWFAGFVVGMGLAFLSPMWFWVVRPLVAGPPPDLLDAEAQG